MIRPVLFPRHRKDRFRRVAEADLDSGSQLPTLSADRPSSCAGDKSPRRLPVLLATAHAMSGDRERLLETSGADGYLEKPVYDSAILVEKVRSLIEST